MYHGIANYNPFYKNSLLSAPASRSDLNVDASESFSVLMQIRANSRIYKEIYNGQWSSFRFVYVHLFTHGSHLTRPQTFGIARILLQVTEARAHAEAEAQAAAKARADVEVWLSPHLSVSFLQHILVR